MRERISNRENGDISESEGLPLDFYTNPEKYDGPIPLWKKTVGLVRQFQNTRPQKREVFLDQVASPLIKDLQSLRHMIVNLDLVSQLQPELTIREIQSQFVRRMEALAARRSSLASWTPERIEDLTMLGLDSDGKTKEVVERIKAALFNAPQSVEEAVDLFYNAAWAMVATKEADIREEIFSILVLEKEWLNSKSQSAVYFELGNWSDDVRISKYSAITLAIGMVGNLLETAQGDQVIVKRAERVHRWDARAKDVLTAPQNKQIIESVFNAIRRKNPARLQQLLATRNMYDRYQKRFYVHKAMPYVDQLKMIREQLTVVQGTIGIEKILLNWDEPLAQFVRGPLSFQLLRTQWESAVARAQEEGLARLTINPIQLTNDLQLEVVATGNESPEQKAEIVREVCESILKGQAINPSRALFTPLESLLELARVKQGGVFGIFDEASTIFFVISKSLTDEEIGRLTSILEYHRPLLSLEKIRGIENHIVLLREELRTRFTKSPGKRGYAMMITDPILRQLGYQTLTFRQDSNNDRIGVKIEISGQRYEFDLDSDYRIILGKDTKRFTFPQDQAWLELLTLSHLKKLICTGEDEQDLKRELLDSEKQVRIYRKQVVGRSEYLKRLPLGQKYSEEAFIKCLKSNFRERNLHRINQDRMATSEGRQWTYVSPVGVVDTPEAKPVKVAFKDASADIRRVLPLGEVSPEELARVEQEILRELERN